MKWIIGIICISTLIAFSTHWLRPKGFPMPEFEFMSMDSNIIYNSKNLPKGKNTIFVYYSPDCEVCQEETRDWIKNLHLFNKTQFYFITNDSLQRIRLFNEVFQIYRYSKIELVWDFRWNFFNTYKPTGTPYLVIYDNERQLKAVIPGGTKSKTLLRLLED